MDKGERINIRLDTWTAAHIEKIVTKTGACKSVVVRTMLLEFLTKQSNNVNDIHYDVNKLKKNKEILLRIDEDTIKSLKQTAHSLNKSVARLVREVLTNYTYSIEKDGKYEDEYKERESKEVHADKRLLNFIESNYNILRRTIIQDGRMQEDVFHDTTLLFVKDEESKKLKSKGSLIAHFRKRYNMLMYRAEMNKRDRKEVEYADYKKDAKEASAE
ncbi:hypothetical protein [uncultured Bacteroides sp.]|uniref:hypothetical protein n=1 Tax=uncultured Bacteroides sp. TaxID=162156 RepID=UPI002AA7832E|nr:hypothetical protein [uncultured Bacteroides sp.]